MHWLAAFFTGERTKILVKPGILPPGPKAHRSPPWGLIYISDPAPIYHHGGPRPLARSFASGRARSGFSTAASAEPSSCPGLVLSSRRARFFPGDEHLPLLGWIRKGGPGGGLKAPPNGGGETEKGTQGRGGGTGDPGAASPLRQDPCFPCIPSHSLSRELPEDEVDRNRGRPTPPRPPPPARPRLASPHALRGRRDQSGSDVSLPIRGSRRAAHTPSTSRADWLRAPPVGPRGQGGPGGRGEKGGGEVVAGTLEAPLAPRPCSGARPPAFPPQLVLSSARAEGCDRPACLAP